MNQRINSRVTPALRNGSGGFTFYEVLIVIAIVGIISAIALPRLLGSSRLISTNGIPREVVAYMRFTRQQAMTQMMVYTCRYDDVTKQITIINHGERNITYDPTTDSMVKLPGNTAASANEVADVNVEQHSLARMGVPASDVLYGRVDGQPATTALNDGVAMTAIPASNQINITFQPDGSVVDKDNKPLNRAMFLYNQQIQQESGFAISVLGTTGRIKLWRYSSNAASYLE